MWIALGCASILLIVVGCALSTGAFGTYATERLFEYGLVFGINSGFLKAKGN